MQGQNWNMIQMSACPIKSLDFTLTHYMQQITNTTHYSLTCIGKNKIITQQHYSVQTSNK